MALDVKNYINRLQSGVSTLAFTAPAAPRVASIKALTLTAGYGVPCRFRAGGGNGMFVDASGNTYITMFSSGTDGRIVKVAVDGTVTTILGNVPGTTAATDGTSAVATTQRPGGCVVDSTGTNLYFCEGNGSSGKINSVRRLTLSTGAVLTIAGSGTLGSVDNTTGTSAQLYNPGAICIASDDSALYISDSNINGVRKIALSGVFPVTTLASGAISGAYGICIDGTANLYVTSPGQHIVVKVALPGGATTTVAGIAATAGSAEGPATTGGRFRSPQGIAYDSTNNAIYVASTGDNAIRLYSLTTKEVTTLVGGGPAAAPGNALPSPGTSSTSFSSSEAWGVNALFSAVNPLAYRNGILYFADNGGVRRCRVADLFVSFFASDGVYSGGYQDGRATAGTPVYLNMWIVPTGQSVAEIYRVQHYLKANPGDPLVVTLDQSLAPGDQVYLESPSHHAVAALSMREVG